MESSLWRFGLIGRKFSMVMSRSNISALHILLYVVVVFFGCLLFSLLFSFVLNACFHYRILDYKIPHIAVFKTKIRYHTKK